jgi:KRAB domain-containing zinc finger protein
MTFGCHSSSQIHKITPAREKPQKCKQCMIAFSTSSYTEIHKRKNIGETPYVCKHWGKAFLYLTQVCNVNIFTEGKNPIYVSSVGKLSFLLN